MQTTGEIKKEYNSAFSMCEPKTHLKDAWFNLLCVICDLSYHGYRVH